MEVVIKKSSGDDVFTAKCCVWEGTGNTIPEALADLILSIVCCFKTELGNPKFLKEEDLRKAKIQYEGF